MKKLLLVVAAAAGAWFVRSKVQQEAADQRLWAEATAGTSSSPETGR